MFAKKDEIQDIDYAALGLMALYPLVFSSEIAKSAGLWVFLSFLSVAAFLWWSMRFQRLLHGLYRVGLMLGLFALIRLYAPVPLSPFHLASFIVFYICFSCAKTRWGRSLRCFCGLFASVALFSGLPAFYGLSAALLAVVVFMGGLLSVWSDLTLNQSIWWFAKRAIRKETVFLIIFVTGIAAIGLRQAQNYANRRLGMTGLSETVGPGGVKHLAFSPELALLIKFDDHPEINPETAYVRAAAFNQTAGMVWRVNTGRILRGIPSDRQDFDYTVILSPRNSEFTPVIDYGVHVLERDEPGAGILPRNNGAIVGGDFSSSWRKYRARSRLVPVHGLSTEEAQYLTQVDGDITPRVVELAKRLNAGSHDLTQFLAELSSYLTSSGFKYSVDFSGDSSTIDKFLFDSKNGFCEHYAATVSTLGRLAGYPSRVVTGFLGGFWDEKALTLYIRDLDVHAWSELWDETRRKWTRFDAVGVLAPDRIESGASHYLQSVGFPVVDDNEFAQSLWWTNLQILIDDFLVGLNSDLSRRTGQFIVNNGEELALAGLAGLLISYIVLVRRRLQRNRLRPEMILVKRLEKFMGARNLERNLGEPIYTWLERCAVTDQINSMVLLEFARAHARFCHGRLVSGQDFQIMRASLKGLKRHQDVFDSNPSNSAL